MELKFDQEFSFFDLQNNVWLMWVHRVFFSKWRRKWMAFCRWRQCGHTASNWAPKAQMWFCKLYLAAGSCALLGSKGPHKPAEKESSEYRATPSFVTDGAFIDPKVTYMDWSFIIKRMLPAWLPCHRVEVVLFVSWLGLAGYPSCWKWPVLKFSVHYQFTSSIS